MTGYRGIKHNSVDRVLLRVSVGACSPEEIREHCNLGTGVVLRAASTLQDEGLIERTGVGRSTQYVVTTEGKCAAGRIRRGGARLAS